MSQIPSKILLAGPWVGEFGWELFCWQGFVRKQSKNFDKTIVIGRPNNSFLYEDFADEFIPFDPMSYKTDAWKCHGAKSHQHIINSIEHTAIINGQFDIGMRYNTNGVNDIKGWFFNEQEFHKYNVNSDHKGYDVIFHCRNKSTGSDRNWSKEQWEKLLAILPDNYKIACIGNSEAFYIEGTDDLREKDLKELIGIMCNSKLIIGPSSGPMHLASLCGLPHLVWSINYNRVRYERDWNPFNTEVIFYDNGGWNPNPSDITKLIVNRLGE